MKACTRCKEHKPFTDFYKDASAKSGLTTACKTCMLAKSRAYKKAHPELHSALARLSNAREKARIVEAYGGVCKCCGETEPQFLCVDHIYNDGGAHRRELGSAGGSGMYRWLRTNGYPQDRFQLLCQNCNSAKGHYGHCPHTDFSLVQMLNDLEGAS